MATTMDRELPTIEAPRTRKQRASGNKAKTNFELHAWVFQRVSGLLLVFLVLGHLLIMNVLDGGVSRINFAFVAGRWSSPFWQTWDFLQLTLAMAHGTLGLRTVVNDYATRPQTRFTLKMLLYVSSAFTVALGTIVIFTFDPSIS